MAPKKNANKAAAAAAEPAPAPPSAPAGPTAAAAIPGTMTSQPKAVPNTKISSGAQNWDKVLGNIYNHYVNNTPQRTKLIDVFMVFLVAVGALQFLYCVLAGNYPFNAFLSGFSATVGQFVLTASLRIQTTEANKADFPSVSPERAFADYVACSLILHFFCVNFIN
ncbi:Dolichyl-diphosphooligosaccharide--protein glycosyltransferase subunit dad1 [Colletotrichum gloeosporioides]|uniref:Dolichyl-diphosphooligosaccharide--protein glycosyltransferase subunit OST2 n=1 Tax=Colletotrichum gloeosporioides TaxID=474922 RepID=A0A8H4FRR0_COLGL|nr:Dolichyl-diphosphooligosaccharide--protein glycosyltransferase subunit dad1 [Colletotrichum gloeosporioides]KAF3812060.1 Dolichyl-diphosphooligosaccharide--protein glycosyltransferase subunit dad1 [Colletotrichum gloeosporioides]